MQKIPMAKTAKQTEMECAECAVRDKAETVDKFIKNKGGVAPHKTIFWFPGYHKI